MSIRIIVLSRFIKTQTISSWPKSITSRSALKWKPGKWYPLAKDFLGANISEGQAKTTNKLAIEEIEGSFNIQFNKLRDYAEKLRKSNPGFIGKFVTWFYGRNSTSNVQKVLYLATFFERWLSWWLSTCFQRRWLLLERFFIILFFQWNATFIYWKRCE